MRRTAAVCLIATACAAAQEPELVPVAAEVRAAASLVVRSPVAGTVARLMAGIGDRPKAAQPLVMVSSPELQVDLARAEADLHAEEMVLEIVAAGERVARTRLEILRRRLAATAENPAAKAHKARLEIAEVQLANKRSLFEGGRASIEDVARAEADLEACKAAIRDAEDATLDLRDGIAVAEHEHARAVAEVRAQRARIDATRDAREAARVRAESGEVKCLLSGARISRVFVQRGELIAAGDALLELVDDGRVRLLLEVPAALAPRVRAGTAVRIERDDGAPARLEAAVQRVTGVIDPDTQTMTAQVELENQDGLWLPGLRLQVRLRPEGSR